MTVADINTDDACHIEVSRAMRHISPEAQSEVLTREDTFPQNATSSGISQDLLGGVSNTDLVPSVSSSLPQKPARSGGLKTTVQDPEAVQRDQRNYMYSYNLPRDAHIPGVCQCEDCVKQQKALMEWAMDAAKQQHAQSIADATAAAERAQRTGEGPKPMMVTPYKHNWVISGKDPESTESDNNKLLDWEGIRNDVTALLSRESDKKACCSPDPSFDQCKMM